MLSWIGMLIFRSYNRKQRKSGSDQQIEGDSVDFASEVRISNSTVIGPVAGRDVSIETFVQQINPAPEQQRDEYHERPTPTEIIVSIEKVSLFNQPSVARSYIGCKVRWQTKLSGLRRTPKRDDLIAVFLRSNNWAMWVSTTVRLSEYPLLRSLKEGEPIEVAGTIAHVATDGDVELKDAKLRFKDSAT